MLSTLDVRGEDIMELGYSGSEIGEKLEYLLSLVIEGQCPNDRDQLLSRIKKN